MKIIVQKFGGTSVKSAETRLLASEHVEDALRDGYKVVVVVSAMGRKGDPYATDTLLNLVEGNKGNVSKRELDLLASCGETISAVVFSNLLNSKGIKALAMTGAEAGFRTNEDYTNAKIVEMKVDALNNALEDFDVIVVTGFQGQTPKGTTATLGRGGSDTSATALGAALQAEVVDIFTDVEGVMTADPRIVNQAKPLSVVTYNEICNLAYQGAKVIHPRAVEVAMQAKVPIRIRSTASKEEGTLITSSTSQNVGRDVEERPITGIAHVNNVTQIKVFAEDGDYDLQTKVFKAMANEGISVDFINIHPMGVVYTVSDDLSDRAVELLQSMDLQPQFLKGCAKVSAVGAGMTGVPGVTSRIVEALTSKNIPILQSADSHTTIWVLVRGEDMINAVNALHEMFLLEKDD
ncbi:aspartate kinase [Evansella cellulosilytica]|uniref:Aspartokinase n=1 Tax=Evansella cellulosilytica (strain ATCC 21833 / DSM 2522 / FERM P-1141 / JCM 9156 / N-4) TaxID=649639 RepID=E6TS46_EVAC2|nr:aspartate kinase [Evansella cellulosilytica]ADU30700.1 aspartate kinase, monofunctional class [Evansella cellulosilytica DSM 2522]